ncbi:MAG: M16 family metallopeptidase [Deltaproteobacteria bacterium]
MLLVLAAAATIASAERSRLDNGLVFLLAPDPDATEVTIELAYDIGTADEPPGHEGLAKLLTWLADEGTKKGGVRAYSLLDATVFEMRVRPRELPAALARAAARVHFPERSFDQKTLEARLPGYVANARHPSPNPIYARVSYELSYGVGHPFAAGPDGDPDSLALTTLADVRAFARTFTPALAALVLAGNFDLPSTRKRIHSLFDGIPRIAAPVRKRRDSQAPSRIRATTKNPAITAPSVAFIWPVEMRPLTPRATVAWVLTVILGAGDNARLRRDLIRGVGVAGEVDSRQAATRLGGRIWLAATAHEDGDIDRLEQALKHELETLRQDGVTQQEVDDAVKLLRTAELREARSAVERARQLALFEVRAHDGDFLTRELEQLRAVTPESVLAFIREHMTDANRIDLLGDRP